MLYTKQNVRDNIRNREGKRVFYLGKEDRLTPEARDYLNGERIAVLSAEAARPERYRLISGGYMDTKPEYMTHLNSDVLVPKNHPRIGFRGAMDTLEGQLLLCCGRAEGKIRADLGNALEFARNLVRYEVLEEPVPEVSLGGMDPKQLRERSHHPQDYYGQPHFMPMPEDGELLLLVNAARCAARAAELAGVAAFPGDTREDLLRALNRLSSFLYLIMIELKASQQHPKKE